MQFETRVAAAAALLPSSLRPLVFLGEGTFASAALTRLTSLLDAAVALSPGCDYAHPELAEYLIGRYSFGHRPGAASIVQDADVVLGINVDFSEFMSRGCRDFSDKTIIHVFDSTRHFLRGARPAVCIRAAVDSALNSLSCALERLPRKTRPCWQRPIFETRLDETALPGTIHPRALVRALQRELPDELTVALDIGGFTAHVLAELRLGPGHRLFCPIEREGVMGEAMLAALGLYDAEPDRPVLVIVGDGGFSK